MARVAKRPRTLDEVAEGDCGQVPCSAPSHEHDESALVSDAEAAMLLLCTEFTTALPGCGFTAALKSQLYSILHNRTTVDKELESLQLSGTVRLFKVAAGPDDYLLMTTMEYVRVVRALRLERIDDVAQHGGSEVSNARNPDCSISLFIQRIIPSCPDVHVSVARLKSLMQNVYGRERLSHMYDHHVSFFLTHNLLTRDPRGGEQYLFSFPGMGSVVKSILAGRKEILQIFSRRKYGELSEKAFMQRKRLATSHLPLKFHIRDAVGQGWLQRIDVGGCSVLKFCKSAQLRPA